jgi:glycosyltransferase involved in cell wall biosynthesis
MRVLVAAFACRPGAGSEPGAGWALPSGAARAGHDVTLITQRRNRSDIMAAIAAEPALDGLHPHFIGLPAAVMERWDSALGLRGLQLYYLAWQLPLLVRARKLHRTWSFDVAHHATMTNDWIPSGLALAGIPAFVWGPLGGGERVPRSCRAFLGPRGRILEWVRVRTAGKLGVWPGRASARRATLLVAQNEDEAASLRHSGRPVVVSPNVFLDPSWFTPSPDDTAPKENRPAGKKRQALYMGRLVAWKGIYLAIQTMRDRELAEWELHVYGRGSERRRAESMIRRWHLGDRIFIHEPVSRLQVRQLMEEADALLYPSMRDAASWVVGEALAVGCPVVCLDIGGPPLLVKPCGTAVAIDGDVSRNLARALASTPDGARCVVRWGEDRVPALIEDWYARATERQGQSLPLAR